MYFEQALLQDMPLLRLRYICVNSFLDIPHMMFNALIRQVEDVVNILCVIQELEDFLGFSVIPSNNHVRFSLRVQSLLLRPHLQGEYDKCE